MTFWKQRNWLFHFRLRRGFHIARRVIEEAIEDDVLGVAAQLSFYFLLAVFPFLLLVATLLPYLSRPDALETLTNFIHPVVPSQVTELVMGNLHTLLTQKRQGLLSFSAITMLWSASSGFLAIMQGLNVAYGVVESRPAWKARLMAMGMTVVLGILVLMSTLLLAFGQLLNQLAAQYLFFPVIFWVLLRWVVALLFFMLTLDIIYYAAPNVRHPWRWFSPGALVATPAWVTMSLGFTLYLRRFGRYEATYGALAAITILMLWFYFSGVVFLVGGELNFLLERKVLHEAEAAAPGQPAA